jgi:ATP-dependent RNA helicase RhlE
MPREIRSLADALLDRPEVVELARRGPAGTIEHKLVSVREDDKRDLLERVLDEGGCHSAIVFTRTKHRARRLAQQLDRAGHRAVSLQGNMSQAQRDRAMQGFRKQRFDVLVATDIAARGIDVAGVSHVINFDVPTTPEAYTHRIGRTGRSEEEGQALTFVTGDDAAWLRATERKLGAPIPRRTVDGFEAGPELAAPGRPARGRKPGSGRSASGANGRTRGNGAGAARRSKGGNGASRSNGESRANGAQARPAKPRHGDSERGGAQADGANRARPRRRARPARGGRSSGARRA